MDGAGWDPGARACSTTEVLPLIPGHAAALSDMAAMPGKGLVPLWEGSIARWDHRR